jgi:hypothetical protein
MTWAAVLAAVVSILAAITAAWQARSVTRLNHKILALDRQAEQLRDDYRDLFKAIGDNTESMVRYRSITAAGEVLRAHPQANKNLCEAIEQLFRGFATANAGREPPKGSTLENIDNIRQGFRESMADIEQIRSGLLR